MQEMIVDPLRLGLGGCEGHIHRGDDDNLMAVMMKIVVVQKMVVWCLSEKGLGWIYHFDPH